MQLTKALAMCPCASFFLSFCLWPALGSSLVQRQADSKVYPVTQVVNLLKEMQDQLEKEQDEDEEVYEKLACWCESNDKAKTKAIADAEAKLAGLAATIDQLTAQSATLNTQIANLEEEIAKNEKSLEVATALRKKQLAEFNEEEKEMLQSISALKSAIVVLSKHHGAAALPATIEKVMKVASEQLSKHKVLLQRSMMPHQRRILTAFEQEDAGKPKYAAYKPQSGEIFGILNQMKETFEIDLADSQKEEAANQAAYEELKKAKEKEIAAGKASLQEKNQQLAATDEQLVNAKEDNEDTIENLGADRAFLADLKEKCALTDSEWEERQKMRQEELTAVSQAIAILTSDDSKDLFSRTFNPEAGSFLQVNSFSAAARRQQVVSLLRKVAIKFNNPMMSALAITVRLDSFTKVKEAIDEMVAQLRSESAQEIEQRDFCVGGFNENEINTQKTLHDQATTQAKIDKLKTTIAQLADELKTLQAEITELQTELRRAGEDREAENKVYQGVIADQRETQKVLQEALTVINRIYASSSAMPDAALIQKGKQDPPPGFEKYEKQSGFGVTSLIQQIMADAKEMEAKTEHDENQAQIAYESYVQETNASIQAKNDSVTNKMSQKAQAETDLTNAESELDGINGDLESLSGDKAALHQSCDFILKNFDVRQQSRAQEVEALNQAKAILSGMK